MRLLTTIIAATFFLSSCGKEPAKQAPQASTTSAPVDYRNNVALVTKVSASSEGIAPNFTWHDSTGALKSLSDFRGKAVLINFWATWCGPCKAELPDVEDLSKQYGTKGLVVIGVSVDKGGNLLGDVSDFVSQKGLTYQIVIDNDDNTVDAYGNINAIPTSFLIDKNGKIVEKWLGARDKTFFQSTIAKYL